MIITDEDLMLPIHELKKKIEDNYPEYRWYKYRSHPGEAFIKFKGDYPIFIDKETHVLIYDWDELLDLPVERFKLWFMTQEEFYNYYRSRLK